MAFPPEHKEDHAAHSEQEQQAQADAQAHDQRERIVAFALPLHSARNAFLALIARVAVARIVRIRETHIRHVAIAIGRSLFATTRLTAKVGPISVSADERLVQASVCARLLLSQRAVAHRYGRAE